MTIADEDRADERRDAEKHQRFGHGHGCLELAIEVGLGDVGDANQFLIEFGALFRPRRSSRAPPSPGTNDGNR